MVPVLILNKRHQSSVFLMILIFYYLKIERKTERAKNREEGVREREVRKRIIFSRSPYSLRQ